MIFFLKTILVKKKVSTEIFHPLLEFYGEEGRVI
jgi:hypothetical protein